MDIKQIIKWSLHRWWWFVISFAIGGAIAVAYFLLTQPKYEVDAILMLRQTDSGNDSQEEMLQMMGVSGNKIVGDEVKVLTSRELMGRVVDSLHLHTSCIKKGERFWEEQFATADVHVTMSQPVPFPIHMQVVVKNNLLKLKLKYNHHSQKIVLSFAELNRPIQTIAGEMHLTMNVVEEGARYKIRILPRVVAIETQLQSISVNRLSRESNVITLTTKSTCPSRSIATINTLLDLYNQSAVTDKNRVAVQTEMFLTNRIAIVAAELTRIESELESYKRSQQIADLEKAATTYQQTGLAYQQQMAELESELDVLAFMAEQLADPANRYTMIPGNMGVSDNTLALLIQDYNERVAHRNQLLQTATAENPIVVQETELINQKRSGIQVGIVQARQTLMMRKEFVQKQQQQYDSRLAAIPQTERYYLELCRDKTTKEKQYLYLIEKQEENAMLLASEAIPAKVVDRAQMNPIPAAPKLKIAGLIALLLGLILPYSVYFFQLIRKEYL